MKQFASLEAQRILVTGGAGTIGSAIVRDLLEEGFSVTALDNLRTGSLTNLPRPDAKLKFVQADLCDTASYARQIEDCDAIFHFATLRKWPEKDDFAASLGLIGTLRNSNIRLFVLHSTAMVYGNANVFPTPETYGPLDPLMSYEITKLNAERLIATFALERKLPAIILRFANVVGGKSYHGVARDYFERLLVNPTKLRVLGDGLQRRSFTYIEDCIGAIGKAVENVKEGLEIYNVASEDAINLHEVIDAVAEQMGIRIPDITHTGAVSEGGGWPGDPRIVFPDTTKLKSRGWRADYSSKSAIRKAVAEMSEHVDLVTPLCTDNLSNSSIELRILEKSHWDREYERLGPHSLHS